MFWGLAPFHGLNRMCGHVGSAGGRLVQLTPATTKKAPDAVATASRAHTT